MIRRTALLEEFEKAQMRRQPADYFRNLEIFEAMYREAKALGALPLKNPLEGIEVDIRLAKALNVRTPAGKDQPGSE